jgi:2,4-didehydro-3-deoxy-L-rhamnonate hydrolase
MKLFRYGKLGQESPGIIDTEGKLRNVSAFGEDYDENFFQTHGIERLQQWVENNPSLVPFLDENHIRFGSPVCKPSKIICIGLNYSDHAQESNMELPKEPVVFFKSTSAIVGAFDSLIIPKNSEKTDWEVELAVVIGQKASYIDESEAMHYVAGYTLHNDYSERAFQLERSGSKAKVVIPLLRWVLIWLPKMKLQMCITSIFGSKSMVKPNKMAIPKTWFLRFLF